MASTSSLQLRYGTNPHQAPATVRATNGGPLPFRVLNGSPSAINVWDAVLSWQLARELRAEFGVAAAASFKHLSPTGAALGLPLPPDLRESYFVGEASLSPSAVAYARARGADRLCAFGDCAAFSDVVDESAAALLHREVSDVVAAPGYEPAALSLLKEKRGGRYLVLEMDEAVPLPGLERRDLFGVTIEQPSNAARVSVEALERGAVTRRTILPAPAGRDLLLATIALRYTQSNSVTVAFDGQLVGVGCGQQSRVHCVELATAKLRLWHLRRHPSVRRLPFRAGISRPERDNAIDLFLRDEMTANERQDWQHRFEHVPERLSKEERAKWLARVGDVCLSSDGLIPFRDSIDRAAAAGVSYVAQPGGSTRDEQVIAAADEHGIFMTHTGIRLFTH